MAATPDRRRPPINSSVRRVLFPSSLKEEVKNDNLSNTLKEELTKDREEASQRWNFDFERSVPLPGRFEWTRLEETCDYLKDKKSQVRKQTSDSECEAKQLVTPEAMEFTTPSDANSGVNIDKAGVFQYTNPQKLKNEMTPALKLKRKRNSKDSPASLKRVKRDAKKKSRTTFKIKRSLLF